MRTDPAHSAVIEILEDISALSHPVFVEFSAMAVTEDFCWVQVPAGVVKLPVSVLGWILFSWWALGNEQSVLPRSRRTLIPIRQSRGPPFWVELRQCSCCHLEQMCQCCCPCHFQQLKWLVPDRVRVRAPSKTLVWVDYFCNFSLQVSENNSYSMRVVPGQRISGPTFSGFVFCFRFFHVFQYQYTTRYTRVHVYVHVYYRTVVFLVNSLEHHSFNADAGNSQLFSQRCVFDGQAMPLFSIPVLSDRSPSPSFHWPHDPNNPKPMPMPWNCVPGVELLNNACPIPVCNSMLLQY